MANSKVARFRPCSCRNYSMIEFGYKLFPRTYTLAYYSKLNITMRPSLKEKNFNKDCSIFDHFETFFFHFLKRIFFVMFKYLSLLWFAVS